MPSEALWPWLGQCPGTSRSCQVAVLGPEPSVNVGLGLGPPPGSTTALASPCKGREALTLFPSNPSTGLDRGNLPVWIFRQGWMCLLECVGAHQWGPQSSGRCSSCPLRISGPEEGEMGLSRPAERALGSFPWGSRSLEVSKQKCSRPRLLSLNLGRTVFASQLDQFLVEP